VKSDPQVLFQTNRPLADRIARNYSNIPGVGMEDVTSIAYDALYRAACAYLPDRGLFEPFAGTVIRNALNSFYQSELRHARHFVTETSLVESADEEVGQLFQAQPDPSQDTVHDVRVREARAVLNRHLPSLTDRAQEVLDLYLRGYSYEEIGQKFGVSKQAAHKTAASALEHLRRHLNSEGIHGVEGGMLPASNRVPSSHFQPSEKSSFWDWLFGLFRR